MFDSDSCLTSVVSLSFLLPPDSRVFSECEPQRGRGEVAGDGNVSLSLTLVPQLEETGAVIQVRGRGREGEREGRERGREGRRERERERKGGR